MELIISLVVSVVFVVLFRKPLAAHPGVFYVLAVVIDVVFLGKVFFAQAPQLMRMLSPYFNRSIVAFGLMSIVMFTGVFAPGLRLRKVLNPIRGELSIVASILMVGHVVNYLASYATSLMNGALSQSTFVLLGFATAVLLVVLLAVLAITSVRAIKVRMASKTWKRIQWWAYVFYGLIYVHVLFFLGPSAAAGAQGAAVSVAIYTVIFATYAILRLRKSTVPAFTPKDAIAYEKVHG